MTKISRYFLTEFLRPLFFSYAALSLLILVAELMERLDKFLAGGTRWGVVFQYLLYLLPTRTMELLPVACLLAALFALGNLSRRNEITAAMSGGLDPWTCVKPLLTMGLVLSALSWGLGEWVVPTANRRAKNLWNLDIRRLTSQRQMRYDNLTVAGENNAFYSIGLLDLQAGRMENVIVDLTREGRPSSQIQARAAEWREGGWVFRDGVERFFEGDGLSLSRQNSFQENRFPLPDRPVDLVPQEPDPEEMSYKELNRYLRRLRVLGVSTRRKEVDLHIKMAFPLANFIILLLGIPLAFQKSSGKVKAIGSALGVAFLYFGLMQVGRALGQKPWVPPLVGAWLANSVFLLIGGALFWRMRRLS